MHQLLLMRHAKSSWDDSSLPDRERSLNVRGRQTVTRIRLAMRDLGLTPDIILVSTARRTLETLELLEPWDETPLVEPMEALYLASTEVLLAHLHKVAETARSVLLIGHNPGLHELAMYLIGYRLLNDPSMAHQDPLPSITRGFPSGALAEFTVGRPWAQLGEGGGNLVRFLTPHALESGV